MLSEEFHRSNARANTESVQREKEKETEFAAKVKIIEERLKDLA